MEIDPNRYAWWAEAVGEGERAGVASLPESAGFHFSELRVSVPFKKVEFFAGFETEPAFESSVDVRGGGFDSDRHWDSNAKVRAYDAGVVLPFRFGSRWALRPWAGVTHLEIHQEISEQWSPVVGASTSAGSESREYDDRLWGAAYGADVVFHFTGWLSASARALQRWGAGTTSLYYFFQVDYFEEPYEPGDEPVSSTHFEGEAPSFSSTAMMFGFDLGLRADIVRWVAIEGGWRYRNWDYDRNPGVYDGPYLRLPLRW